MHMGTCHFSIVLIVPGGVATVENSQYPFMITHIHTLEFRLPPTTLNRHRSLLKIRNLISALSRLTPPHNTIRIHSKPARRLPSTPTLRRPIPNPLLPPQLPHLVKPTRTQHMPKTRHTQSPRAISLPPLINNNLQIIRLAARLWQTSEPGFRSGWGRVGDCDERDIPMGAGCFAEVKEGFLGEGTAAVA
jgi:hypothetical protein